MSLWRELLLGPAYWYHRRLIAKSKTWDGGTIEDYQRSRLTPLLAHYGDAIKTKAEYREHPGRYQRLSLPGLTTTIRTGGTTASPFAFRMDSFARRQKERAYIFDIWSEIGYRPFDTRVVFRGNIGERLLSYNRLENAWQISPAKLDQSTRVEVLNFLRRLGPFFLHVYPSSLFALIEILGRSEFRSLPVRGVMAGSEAFPFSQMQAFESDYGIRVAHWYGHSEYASLARFCHDCGGFHFYPTYGATELFPYDQTRSRIVATSFNFIGTRFVRYDTGDLARASSRDCPAPFFRVDAIEGRVQEFFLDRDGGPRAFGPYLFGIHNRFWDIISSIQFIQRQAGRLQVRVVCGRQDERPWLEQYLRERFAVVDLEFDYVEAIARTAAGKHRYFISDMPSVPGAPRA